jgi:hypothetical protein
MTKESPPEKEPVARETDDIFYPEEFLYERRENKHRNGYK